MDTINRAKLDRLVAREGGPHVSIYISTEGPGREMRQNVKRYEHLLANAEELLKARGAGFREVERLMRSARLLAADDLFWRQPHRLAVLAADKDFHVYFLAAPVLSQVHVDCRYHVRPLLKQLNDNVRFFLLTLSQNRVRLWRGNRDSLEEVRLPGLPEDLDQALDEDVPEGFYEAHSGRPDLPGKEGAVFHGKGGKKDVHKSNLLAYCRAVDGAVAPYVNRFSQPLVFAGAAYLFPIYQRVNSCRLLLEKPLPGNPDHRSPVELLAEAVAVVAPPGDKTYSDDLTCFQAQAGSGRTSENPREIVTAAERGQIAALFATENTSLWGRYEPRTESFKLATAATPHAENLCDRCVARTLTQGGRVHVRTLDAVTSSTGIAALLRYPVSAGHCVETEGGGVGPSRDREQFGTRVVSSWE